MGSPMVFQTAPPQPASKARMTWSPQFAGGPEASQKGLGQRMPLAKLVVRSAIGNLFRHTGRNACATKNANRGALRNCVCGAFAFRYGIYYFAASVYAVAAREILWVCGLTGLGIDHD